MTEPRFLGLDEVLRLHEHLIATFGGDVGIHNPAGLESALAQPLMTAFGSYLHPDRIDQAGAYLYHLVANHPFFDGNKRIGLHTALVFLETNGAEILGDPDTWYHLTMGVAKGELHKREVTSRMRSLVRLQRNPTQ